MKKMKKFTLLFLSVFCALTTFAQTDTSGDVLDTSGGTDYYIQFSRPDTGNQGVIQDTGEDVDLRTKKALATTGSQLWNVTLSSGKYVLTNKLGREIGFSDFDLFQATAAGAGVLFDIVVSNNVTYPDSWELQRDGQSNHMNQVGGAGFERTLAEWVPDDQGNPLKFIKEADALDPIIGVVGGLGAPLTSVLPTLDTYYYIQFTVGAGVLEDKGDGNALSTAYPHEDDDNQQWKVTGTTGNYMITSKAGNIIDFDGSANFTTTSGSTTTFALVENIPSWEIQRSGETTTMSQEGGAGFSAALAEFVLGDDNNILEFVLPADVAYAPKISSGGTDYYYYIEFLSSNNYIQDMGDFATTTTQVLDTGDDSQLWKVTGSEDAMVLESKDGLTLEYIGFLERYVTSSDPGSPLLILKRTTNNTYSNGWEIHRDEEIKAINQFGGGAPGAELGEWFFGDNNNPLRFRLEGGLVGVDNFSIKESIKLFPNPFKDTFSISFKNTSASKAHVNLYSVTGKLVKSESLLLNNSSITVDGSGLNKGFYIVEVMTNEGRATSKLLKQ
ncbi:MAG: hypothetical protein ACI8ZX_000728 [Planctomycetota bacterium]|jgi:hypothetical protein